MMQSGGFGDIITCAPIAKKYADSGYDVYWPVREMMLDLLSRFDYVTPIVLNDSDDIPINSGLNSGPDDWLKADVVKCLKIYEEEGFDYALNLADRGPHPTAQLPHETCQEPKYRLSNVPFEEIYNLSWTRNINKEESLYTELVGSEDEYVLAALTSSDNEVKLPIQPDCKVIEMDIKDGYVIFDWYKIIKNAKAIYAVESSFHCFMDGIIHEITCPKYRLQRMPGRYYTVSEHWTNYD